MIPTKLILFFFTGGITDFCFNILISQSPGLIILWKLLVEVWRQFLEFQIWLMWVLFVLCSTIPCPVFEVTFTIHWPSFCRILWIQLWLICSNGLIGLSFHLVVYLLIPGKYEFYWSLYLWFHFFLIANGNMTCYVTISQSQNFHEFEFVLVFKKFDLSITIWAAPFFPILQWTGA